MNIVNDGDAGGDTACLLTYLIKTLHHQTISLALLFLFSGQN